MSKIKFMRGVFELKVNIIDFDSKSIKYSVSNTPICQYDQHSRARIGIKFQNYKVSEEPEYVLYTALHQKMQQDKNLFIKTIATLEKLESKRILAEYKEDYNLMSRNCSYEVIQDYASLQGQMSRRLKFCEEEFIVGLHWLLRHKMIEAGINHNQAKNYLPGCDAIKSCDYSSADYLSNAFGCLFAGCGRWESHAKYASFNESCTTPSILEKQLGIKIPLSEYQK